MPQKTTGSTGGTLCSTETGGSRIVVPTSTRLEILAKIHKGHHRIAKCREWAKSYNTRHKSLKQKPFFLNFLREKFLTFTLHTFVLTQMCPSPSPVLSHAYFGALWWLQYPNQRWEGGKSHKCFKICDEFCSCCATEKQRWPETNATTQEMRATHRHRAERLIAAPPLFLAEGGFSPPRIERHGLPDSFWLLFKVYVSGSHG